MDTPKAAADRCRIRQERSSHKTLPAISPRPLVPPCPPRLKDPAKILHPDSLSAIFIHITNGDLSRCLRVNHLFFDLAGKILYSHAAYGRDPLPGRASLNFLSGAYGPSPSVSPSKAVLLSHVRFLEFQAHAIGTCTDTPYDNLLPFLDTLTIIYRIADGDQCFTACNFLRSLRPKAIRLIDDRIDRAEGWHISLEDTFELSAERVSLHATFFHPSHRYLSVIWPRSMQQLDIHLQREEPYPVHHLHPQVRIVTERQLVERAIGSLLASASEHEAKLRVVGLRSVIGLVGAEAQDITGSPSIRSDFTDGVREWYGKELREKGIQGGDVDRRAAELEFIMVNAPRQGSLGTVIDDGTLSRCGREWEYGAAIVYRR